MDSTDSNTSHGGRGSIRKSGIGGGAAGLGFFSGAVSGIAKLGKLAGVVGRDAKKKHATKKEKKKKKKKKKWKECGTGKTNPDNFDALDSSLHRHIDLRNPNAIFVDVDLSWHMNGKIKCQIQHFSSVLYKFLPFFFKYHEYRLYNYRGKELGFPLEMSMRGLNFDLVSRDGWI